MPTNKEMIEATIAGVRGCLIINPLVASKCEDVIAIIRGEKIAVTPAKDTDLEKPISRQELAKLLGLNAGTIDYHRKKGRLVPVQIPGSSRILGFTRASVNKCFGVNV